jgi:hypothetical protein
MTGYSYTACRLDTPVCEQSSLAGMQQESPRASRVVVCTGPVAGGEEHSFPGTLSIILGVKHPLELRRWLLSIRIFGFIPSADL